MSQPMTRDELAAWLRDRLADPADLDAMIAAYLGKTEADMDDLYDRICGPTA